MMIQTCPGNGLQRGRGISPVSPVLIFFVFILFLQIIPAHFSLAADIPADLRVGISFTGNHLELSFGNEYCLLNMDSGEPLPLVAGHYRLRGIDGRIEVEDLRGEERGYFQGTLLLQPVLPPFADHSFRLHNALYGEEYRGALEIIPEVEGLLAVNVLDLESYLLSVLPAEMSPAWGIDGGREALKAQAVAARTFALYNCATHRHSSYHLCDQQHCQVYKGKKAENPDTDRAVKETCGEIITYGGQIVESFYHASNGGFTELSQNVWQTACPYLASMPDPYDDPANPLGLVGFKCLPPWVVSLSQPLLRDLLAEKGYNIGEIERVKIVSSYSSGRVEEILLQGKSGETISLVKEKAWKMLGLDSQLYTVCYEPETHLWAVSAEREIEVKECFPALEGKWVINGQYDQGKSVLYGHRFHARGAQVKDCIPYTGLVFAGQGRGHGVGMSQYGAYNRSRAGQSYQEIISFYYPGTEIAIY